MWYVSLAVLLHYSQSKIVFSFQQTNVASRRNGLGLRFLLFKSCGSLPVPLRILFVGFNLQARESPWAAHLWVPHVDGEVEVCKKGVWCGSVKEVRLPWSLISLVSMVSHSHPIEWERETLGRRLKFLLLTGVFSKGVSLQARKENSLFHSNFFLRDNFLYPHYLPSEILLWFVKL